MHRERGFTLIELLVVIAIIAVLSVVVILSLNPAELLRQARDSNRISDLATLRSALSVYLADVTSPKLASSSLLFTAIYTSFPSSTGNAAPSSTWGIATLTTSTPTAVVPTRTVDALGWLPVKFTDISSGSPIGSLPIDPSNGSSSFYCYAATSSNLSFKLTAKMESGKYSSGATNVEASDGGIAPGIYEQGTGLNL